MNDKSIEKKLLTDRRLHGDTSKTTTKIKLALLELLNETELAKINITDLVKVAGIYRATFYLHYKSLGDVIADIERDVFNSYNLIEHETQDIDIYNNMPVLIEKIGQYVELDKRHLKIIINANCFNRITLRLKELLHNIVLNNFTQFGHMQDCDEFALNISMFTGGVVFAYRDWINNPDMEFHVLENYIKKISKKIFKNSKK